jgi:hypothetical protein
MPAVRARKRKSTICNLQSAIRKDERLCERYRDLLKDNFEALLLRRLRVVWYSYRASRRRNLYRGVRRFQLAVLACLDVLMPWDQWRYAGDPRLPTSKSLAALDGGASCGKGKSDKHLRCTMAGRQGCQELERVAALP